MGIIPGKETINFGLRLYFKLMVSFPGIIPEKWAKQDDEKETMKPDMAKEWAQEIASQIQSK